MLMVYLALVSHPNRSAIGELLRDNGFIQPRHPHFTGDLRGVVRFLWRHWFDTPAGAGLPVDCSGDQSIKRPRKSLHSITPRVRDRVRREAAAVTRASLRRKLPKNK
jgi:hypothetical protein